MSPKQTSESYCGREEYLRGAPVELGSLSLDPDLFTADDDGDVTIQPGTVLAKPSATDLWGPYYSCAEDGRETATNNVVVLHDYIEVAEAEVSTVDPIAAYLIDGLVDGAQIILEDGTEASAEIRDALRSRLCNVKFDIGT